MAIPLDFTIFEDMSRAHKHWEDFHQQRQRTLQAKQAAGPLTPQEQAELNRIQILITANGPFDPLRRWTDAFVGRSFGRVVAAQYQRGASLSDDELRLAALYGLLSRNGIVAPSGFDPFDDEPKATIPLGRDLTAEEAAERDRFSAAFFAAVAEYEASKTLFKNVFQHLRTIGDPGPNQNEIVSAQEWAGVVRFLRENYVVASDPQLHRKVNVALASVEPTGGDDGRPPSTITIDLPDLEQASAFEIIADNISATIPIFVCSMLDELKVFQVVDRLVLQFQDGTLPVKRGPASNFLYRYWRESALRISEAERRTFYARAFGTPGGDDTGLTNGDFTDLSLRFVSSVATFFRQDRVDSLLRASIPAPINQQNIRKAARDLAANLSMHAYGIFYPVATDLQKQIRDVITLLSDPELRSAYGAKDMWGLVDQVAALELGGPRNSVKYRTLATSGAIILAWLAKNAQSISRVTFEDLIDVSAINSPPARPAGSKATTDPTDYDLVNACLQYATMLSIDSSRLDELSAPREAPVTPSQPIQIPGIARQLLDSVEMPPMGLGLGRGASYARQ